MKLPNISKLIKRNGKNGQEFILALELGASVSKAAAWQNKKDILIHKMIKGVTPNEVIKILKEEFSFSKIVFGLPESYVDSNKIKDEYIPRLKKIAKDFNLTPLGFVVIKEAIIHYLEAEQEVPPTAILLHVEDTKLTFSLFRVGKCTAATAVKRTDLLLTDIENGLKEFADEEILPSRIILYNGGKSISQFKETLLSYPWSKNDKFLHVPKIDILKWEVSIEAIVHAGAAELEESESLPLDSAQDKSPDLECKPSKSEDKLAIKEKASPVSKEAEGITTAADTGKEEIEDEYPTLFEEEKNKIQDTKSAADVGFVTEEIKENGLHFDSPSLDKTSAEGHLYQPAPHVPVETKPEKIHEKAKLEERTMQRERETQTSEKRKPLSALPAVKVPALARFTHGLPRPKGLLPGAAVCGAAVILFIGAFIWYPQVEITLLANPEIIEKEFTVTLNTSISDIDLERGQIPGRVYSITVSDEQTSQTNGIKTIGEKATGKVIAYNKTTSAKTFKQGAVLGTSDGIKFTLDSDVEIASASDTGESLTYGKETVSVTASSIGPDGNIKGDTDFVIDDFSTSLYSAKSESDFSGGTEREIKVASEKDQDNLYEKVLKALKQEAAQKLREQVANDERLLNESLSENVVEKTFDKDIGEETDNLTLLLTLEFSQISYSEEDLAKYSEEFIKDQVSEGFTSDPEKSYFKITDTKKDEEGNVTFTANYHAVLIPNIDVAKVQKELAGKSKQEIEEAVTELSGRGIIGYEIIRSKTLPFIGDRLPILSQNIEVNLESYK